MADEAKENKPVEEKVPADGSVVEEKAQDQSGDSKADEVSEVAAGGGEDSSKASKGKKRRMAPSAGVVHIKATFNNTQVAVTDQKGNVIAWSSAGKMGFKGSRKNTAFAATLVCQDAARNAAAKGMREVEVRVQGAGSGRESAIRALQSVGMNVSVIRDVTSIPHNGCRPRKRRRV